MQLKGKIHTFSIKHKLIDGEELEGQFSCRKQAILDFSKIQRRKSELCGGAYCVRDDNGNATGQGIDEETEYINHVIAVLETMLVTWPQWWDLSVLDDFALLTAVYSEVQKFENSFRRRPGQAPEGEGSVLGGEGAGEKERKEAKSGGNAPKVVDQKVSAALDA